ncbi:MAG: VWA domain-containing protein [Nitratireductor sp.]|nr:VWA domain-containing protein [Nitratireductor sp.]
MPKIGSDAVAPRSTASEISDFLRAASATNAGGSGRIVFALDATMSRQPTWDRAMEIQASMFDAVRDAGGSRGDGACLSVQLAYYRGHRECRASRFVVNADALRDLMTGIECRGGKTQIAKLLAHVRREGARAKVEAMVFIGDAMEENVDLLCERAGELGLLGTRCFFFQEGSDAAAERAFREMARLTNGAFFRLGPNSSRELADLLGAIAVYARGGLKALRASKAGGRQQLLTQLEG